MNYRDIFKLIIFRYYKHNFFKLCLTCIGISLGLALFITTRSYSDTILFYVTEQTKIKSFGELTLKSKDGYIKNADYKTIIKHPSLEKFVAKAEIITKVKNRQTNKYQTITVLGIDSFNISVEDSSLESVENIESLLIAPYSGIVNNHHQLVQNNEIELLHNSVKVMQKVVSQSPLSYTQENVLMLDLVGFFSLFSEKKQLNEIDIKLKTKDKESFIEFLSTINSKYYCVDPNEKSSQLKQLSDSFAVNLIFLSSFAILVSLLISYQFFNFNSASRKKTYQKLLALGMKQRSLLGVIMTEIGIIFLIAYGVSIVLGSLLAKLSLSAVKQTISLLYFPINPSDIVISDSTYLITALIGLCCYLFNIIEPIISIRFQQSFFRQGYDALENRSVVSMCIYGLTGIVLLAISIKYSHLFIQLTESIFGGYANLVIYLIGTLLLIPLFLYCSSRLLKKLKNPFVSAAIMSIDKFPFKNIVTISSLALAFSLFLSLSFFISSFRSTVIDWIEYSNWADVYIYNEANQAQFEIVIDDQLLDHYIQHEDVLFYDFLTHYEFTYNSLPASIIASHHHILEKYPKRLKLQNGNSIKDPLNEVYISESFKQKYQVDIGEKITITGDLGEKDVIIQDVFYSYGTDRGLFR